MSGVHEGVAAVMKGLSHIPKQRSRGVNYEFRSIDAVFNVIHGLLAANHMWLKPKVLDDWTVDLIPGTPTREGVERSQSRALFRLEVLACHADGSETSLGVGLCQSHDYGDKAVYQAQQNGMKYVVIEAFAIPTDEPDMDSQIPDPVTDVGAQQITLIKEDALEMAGGDVAVAKDLYLRALTSIGAEEPVPPGRLNDLAIAVDALGVELELDKEDA